MSPAGALNRTRLYVPARTIWGAVTAELARCQLATFPNYQQVGQQLQQNARFSYLVPAQNDGRQWLAWLPKFEKGKGLVWQREDRKSAMTDRQFRQYLLITQPGTAIAPTSDTAEEGTLREFELISPWWRSSDRTTAPQPVGLVGYVFCQDDALWNELQKIEELFVGGDTRYGLGHLVREALDPVLSFFPNTQVELSGREPVVQTDQLLSHAMPNGLQVVGALECVSGWDKASGNNLRQGQLLWAPGTSLKQSRSLKICEDSIWRLN
jgi:hypothetical protein